MHDLSRLYETSLRGDLDSLESIVPFIRRGCFSPDQYSALEESLLFLQKRMKVLAEILESAHQEWLCHDLMWASGFSQYHLLLNGKRIPLCMDHRFPRIKNPDTLGLMIPKQRTIPEDALWPTHNTGPKGIPICRYCLRNLFRTNKTSFHLLKKAFQDRNSK